MTTQRTTERYRLPKGPKPLGIFVAVGVTLVGVAVAEYRARWAVEQRYQQAVQSGRQLESQVSTFITTHRQVTDQLASERRQVEELSATLAERNVALDQALSRLAEEGRTIQQLELRLSAMTQQMERLQGELALVLNRRSSDVKERGTAAIELERVLVSDDASADLQGRVVSVHSDWAFVVVNLGWDAVKIGDTISISRNDELLAKARVERVQEAVSAATILPEWEAKTIHVNDHVRVL